MFRVAARALFTVALLAGVSACAVSPYEDGYYGGGGGYYGGGGGYYAGGGGGYAYRPAPAWGYGYSRPYYPAPPQNRPPPGGWGGGGGRPPPAMAGRPPQMGGGGGGGGGGPPAMRPQPSQQFFQNENPAGARAEGGGPN